MQIHELNTFAGKPGALDFLPVDNGFDTAKISADKLLKYGVKNPTDSSGNPINGNDGQLLRSKGDGSTEWSDVGNPTDAQIAQAVSDWLDAHPEATTTVQDGSLTEDKFSNALKLLTIKDYITPEMFGAAGDGMTDDTQPVRDALMYAIDNEKKLMLVGKYYITSPLLTQNDYNDTVVVDIEGLNPLRKVKYYIDDFGGIVFDNGLNIFDHVTLRGSIYRVSFMPLSRTQTGSIFYYCELNSFIFDSCSVSNILAFCHNTDVKGTSQIKNNRLLTVYYFAKCDDPNGGNSFTDSVISGNYINGGMEMTDNHCFEWDYFNGSTIINNFIDYYQTIYCPYATQTLRFQGGISIGNQYQMFRYLYYFGFGGFVNSGSFESVGDCFNWMDPSTSTKLAGYTVYQYTGHDGNLHDIPPYIMRVLNSTAVVIRDAIIQSNCKNLIFIQTPLTAYKEAKAEFSCNIFTTEMLDYDNVVSHADSLWNNGIYKDNQIKIPFIKPLNALPSNGFNWSDYYLGEKIKVNNRIYKFVALYNTGTSSYDATWADVTAYL